MEEQSEQSTEVPPGPEITTDCDGTVDVLWLKAKVQAAAVFLGIEQSNISIRIVNDATMSQLHHEYSGVDGTTDVLTFDHGSGEQAIDVDIASHDGTNGLKLGGTLLTATAATLNAAATTGKAIAMAIVFGG